jgi:release factor glutamine methyltransferase
LTVQAALREAQATLIAAGDDEAAAAAERLLMHVLGLSRAELLVERHRLLTSSQIASFRQLVSRRARGEPVAYLTGHQAFRRLTLTVTPDVLIPRPETELLIDLALECRATPAIAIDVGTGSGALALALVDEAPRWRVIATDRSARAIRVARHNRDALGLTVEFVLADLLAGVRGPVGLVLANLPYNDTAQLAALPAGVRDWEPRLALDGGPGGLELIARLIGQASSVLAPGGMLLCEIAADQGDRARQLAARVFSHEQIDIVRDLAGLDRVLRVWRR